MVIFHCYVSSPEGRLLLPRLSHLTAHIITQANSMGLIPKTGEQHLIENNNLNHNNKQQNKTKNSNNLNNTIEHKEYYTINHNNNNKIKTTYYQYNQ